MRLLQPRLLLTTAIVLAAGGISTASILGFAGSWTWAFDLLSHYRLQYAILIALLLAISLATRHKWLIAAMTALFAVHLVPLTPMVISGDQPTGTGDSIRIVHLNVLTENTERSKAARWLADQNAEIVVVQETDELWAQTLDTELEDMTRLDTATLSGFGNFGMAVYINDDFAIDNVEVLDPISTPALAVTIPLESGASPLLLYSIHTVPPLGADRVEYASEQIDLAKRRIADHDGPVALVGDLNATRWSHTFRRVTTNTGLRDGGAGSGITGTWPSPLWFTGMIGIDHVLVTEQIRVDDYWIGPDLGSDHRPVVADLTVVSAT